MAITTNAELKTAVASWLNRGDLTTLIPDFITLAEADIRRRLYDVKATATLTLSTSGPSVALPSTVKALESLRYNTSSRQYALREKSPNGLAALQRSGTGAPQAFSVVGQIVYFDVTPDQAYAMQMTYIESLTSIASAVSPTFTRSPDIWLYGALTHAAPFLEHDERSALWASAFDRAVEGENSFRERQEYSANPEMELPVVFGGEQD